MWYWSEAEGVRHPQRLVKTVTYDYQTQERTHDTLGVMVMDDFGTLVLAGSPDA